MPSFVETAKILIVDDQEANIRMLRRMLRHAGYVHIESTSNALEAMSLVDGVGPDLVLLDLHMPDLDGFELMSQIRARLPREHYLPVLVLTADLTPETRERALSSGARDFLTKPFDSSEALLRIRNLLETRHLHVQLQEQKAMLEQKVVERTAELEAARTEVLVRLATAAEYRDDDTGEHTQRVGTMAARIALAAGLSSAEAHAIRRAALLHDIGKIGIPDDILLKPGRLTATEFDKMKEHTRIGSKILSGGRSPLLVMAETIALAHHERWDGSGYPDGLAAEAIPLSARITTIADVYDALTHARPYKAAWEKSQAEREIVSLAGRCFDPALVRAFLAVQAQGDTGPIEPQT